ncbi:hypothetical protein HK100_005433 [Physocladia obscura]|uniref:Uncharacterized protein n=1 Tax=Physocladia obscura TaxID=109957 RepID=A0AAD5SXC4_9FUNG|nr:hypothetical protein HK100_005433 [Physocladia obscura]
MYSYRCNSYGVNETLLSIWYAPGNGTIYDAGNNGTLEFEYNFGAPGGRVNFSDLSTHFFLSIYAWQKSAYKTAVALAYNHVTKEEILVGNDWTVTQVGTMLQNILSQIPYPMFVVALEAQTGYLIGTSDGASVLNAAQDGIIKVTESNGVFLLDLCSYINATFPNLLLSDQLNQISRIINATQLPIMFNRQINGAQYAVRLDLAPIVWDEAWLTAQYLNMDSVKQNLNKSSKTTEIVILSIIVVAISVGSLFAYVIARQLNLVSTQINKLKHMRFLEVLEKEKGFQNASFVRELAHLQISLHEMVSIFATTLKTSNSLAQRSQTASIQVKNKPSFHH